EWACVELRQLPARSFTLSFDIREANVETHSVERCAPAQLPRADEARTPPQSRSRRHRPQLGSYRDSLPIRRHTPGGRKRAGTHQRAISGSSYDPASLAASVNAVGFSGAAGLPGAQPESEPDALSRGVCTQRVSALEDRTGAAGSGETCQSGRGG